MKYLWEGRDMVMKQISIALILTGSLAYAMDMDRVNALVEQIKAAKGDLTTTTKHVVNKVEKKVEEKVTTPELPKVEIVDVQQQTDSVDKSAAGTISEESLGLRKTNLYDENDVAPAPVKYTDAAPGTSKRFDRAFENAPPMIPHSVEGLLPITKNNNQCLGCHMPDVAPSMGATPIPPSHFRNFRPMTALGPNGEVLKEGHAVENTSDIKMVVRKQEKLYQGRFNCSQCHAPQAEVEPAVKNNFTPDFRSEDGKKKSNLLDTLNEGVE